MSVFIQRLVWRERLVLGSNRFWIVAKRCFIVSSFSSMEDAASKLALFPSSDKF